MRGLALASLLAVLPPVTASRPPAPKRAKPFDPEKIAKAQEKRARRAPRNLKNAGVA